MSTLSITQTTSSGVEATSPIGPNVIQPGIQPHSHGHGMIMSSPQQTPFSPSPIPIGMPTLQQSWETDIERIITNVLTKMKLDTVHTEVSQINTSVQELKNKCDNLETSLGGVKEEQSLSKQKFKSLSDENCMLKQRLEFSENKILEIEKKQGVLTERVISTEYHTMKNNLIFYNIPEAKHPGLRENTRAVLMTFLQEQLKISDAFFRITDTKDVATIVIDRCHRMGGGTPRSIVVVCPFGRDIILRHAKNLAKTNYYISQQLPPEIAENKYRVSAVYRAAKQNGKKPAYIGKGDIVQVDGQKYKALTPPPCVMSTTDLLRKAQVTKVVGSETVTEKGNTFMAHMVDVDKEEDILGTLSIVKHSHQEIARATHNMYVARVGTNDGVHEFLSDDGEFSGTRRILKEMQAYNIVNKLIVLTRWASNYQLGKRRFDIIAHVTRSVLINSGLIPPNELNHSRTTPRVSALPQEAEAENMCTPTMNSETISDKSRVAEHIPSGFTDMYSCLKDNMGQREPFKFHQPHIVQHV